MFRYEQSIIGYKRFFETNGRKLLEKKQEAMLKEIA